MQQGWASHAHKAVPTCTERIDGLLSVQLAEGTGLYTRLEHSPGLASLRGIAANLYTIYGTSSSLRI